MARVREEGWEEIKFQELTLGSTSVQAMNSVKRLKAEVSLHVKSTIGAWQCFGSPFANGPVIVKMQTGSSKLG